MTLTQLEYVVAVATYKSFVAAAEKTFVTQPTLSMQINKLEEELNVKIFDRYKHPISPTEIGEKIVAQAKVILSEAKKIDELVNKSQGIVAGDFVLGVIPTISPYLVPKLIEKYNDDFPDVRLVIMELKTNDIIEKLKNDEIDCGLVSTPLDDNRIKEIPLFYEPLVAYFNPKYPKLKKSDVNINDLDLTNIWLMNEGNCLRNQVLDLCSEHIDKLQKNRKFKFESGHVDTLKKLIDNNGGFSIFPEMSTSDFSSEDQKNIRRFSQQEPVREISLITSDHFVKNSILNSIISSITALVPEHMRAQTKNRRILRIQTSRL